MKEESELKKQFEVKIKELLPSDAEVEQWYADNIDEGTATVSSSIFKFRLWLADRLAEKTKPIVHNLHGFVYEEKKVIK
jgi:hypothetical protein